MMTKVVAADVRILWHSNLGRCLFHELLFPTFQVLLGYLKGIWIYDKV